MLFQFIPVYFCTSIIYFGCSQFFQNGVLSTGTFRDCLINIINLVFEAHKPELVRDICIREVNAYACQSGNLEHFPAKWLLPQNISYLLKLFLLTITTQKVLYILILTVRKRLCLSAVRVYL